MFFARSQRLVIMENKHENDKVFLIDGRFCPNCGEQIVPADIEMFPRCPYCNHLFPEGNQLEDFILKPVLKRWMIHNCQQFMR